VNLFLSPISPLGALGEVAGHRELRGREGTGVEQFYPQFCKGLGGHCELGVGERARVTLWEVQY
jgi:hypothetical protein